MADVTTCQVSNLDPAQPVLQMLRSVYSCPPEFIRCLDSQRHHWCSKREHPATESLHRLFSRHTNTCGPSQSRTLREQSRQTGSHSPSAVRSRQQSSRRSRSTRSPAATRARRQGSAGRRSVTQGHRGRTRRTERRGGRRRGWRQGWRQETRS